MYPGYWKSVTILSPSSLYCIYSCLLITLCYSFLLISKAAIDWFPPQRGKIILFKINEMLDKKLLTWGRVCIRHLAGFVTVILWWGFSQNKFLNLCSLNARGLDNVCISWKMWPCTLFASRILNESFCSVFFKYLLDIIVAIMWCRWFHFCFKNKGWNYSYILMVN